MSIDASEGQFSIDINDATDDCGQVQISAGRDISASMLDRIEAIELYVCELIEVIGQYESQASDQQTKLAVQTPVEFLKWDLLNLVEESCIDTVRLKAMLKSAGRTAGKRQGYLINLCR